MNIINKNYKLNKYDIILASVALFVTLAWFLFIVFPYKKGNTAYVYVDNNKYMDVDLGTNNEIIISENDIYMNISVLDGYINVVDAKCKDKYCIHQKKISKNGEMIVCLPQKIIIKVVGDSEKEKNVDILNEDKNNKENEFDAYTN